MSNLNRWIGLFILFIGSWSWANQVDSLNVLEKKGAVVLLASKSGTKVSGRLLLQPISDNSVSINGYIENLEPNSVHGFHIHENGDCSADDAKSAGGHFNPLDKKHGGRNIPPRHLGDLGNIKADGSGRATINIEARKVNLSDGKDKHSIISKAIVVHGKADDKSSQPSGAAGERIACGVIELE